MPRISQLPSLTSPDAADEIAIVDASAATTKKITRNDFLKGAALPPDTVDTQAIADGSVTADKIDLTTFEYSTTEKVVGKWIDTNPIYERVITGTITASGGARDITDRTDITGIDKLINVSGYLSTGGSFSDYAWVGSVQPASSGGIIQRAIYISADPTRVRVISLFDSSRTAAPYALVIQYTKV